MLCGLTDVILPGKDAITTQIIDFDKNIGFNVEETESALTLTLKGATWGANSFDAKLEFQCNDNMKQDELTSHTWADKSIQLTLKGPSGCLKSKDDDKKMATAIMVRMVTTRGKSQLRRQAGLRGSLGYSYTLYCLH